MCIVPFVRCLTVHAQMLKSSEVLFKLSPPSSLCISATPTEEATDACSKNFFIDSISESEKATRSRMPKMELEVEVNVARPAGDVTFTATETDAVVLVLAHLPGFDRDEIEVQIDGSKMEIVVGGGGQMESSEAVHVHGLVDVARHVEVGRFSQAFSIPDSVVFERIDAEFDEGEEILMILMPKLGREEAPPPALKQIQEEEEVSCDGEGGKVVEDQPRATPIPVGEIEPLHGDDDRNPTEELDSKEDDADQGLPKEEGGSSVDIADRPEQQEEESEEEEIPSEEIPDRTPNLTDSVERVELERFDPFKESDPRQEREPVPLEQEIDVADRHQEREVPAADLGVIKEQEPEATPNPKSGEPERTFRQEDEHPTVEVEDLPPQRPTELPEADTNFSLRQEQGEETQEPYRDPIQDREGSDRDKGSKELETTSTTREGEGWRANRRRPGCPLSATSLFAGSTFLFSLAVLLFHFLREKKRSRN